MFCLGVFVRGVFGKGGFCPGVFVRGFMSGGFCLGVFVPEPCKRAQILNPKYTIGSKNSP